MTDDLVDRLRRIADRWGGGPAELVEAADEIERLRTELHMALKIAHGYADEIERLRAEKRAALRHLTED